MSDKEEILSLIADCTKNNRKAQELLYRRTYAFAIRIALRYSRSEADAADILSQAYINAFRSIHSFNIEKGNFFSWLKRIIINEAIDFYKKLKQHAEIEKQNEMSISVNNEAISSIAADEIMRTISKLPPATHAVFVMYAIDGYNHREIAATLNISAGTSKWHLNQARSYLQKRLLPKLK